MTGNCNHLATKEPIVQTYTLWIVLVCKVAADLPVSVPWDVVPLPGPKLRQKERNAAASARAVHPFFWIQKKSWITPKMDPALQRSWIPNGSWMKEMSRTESKHRICRLLCFAEDPKRTRLSCQRRGKNHVEFATYFGQFPPLTTWYASGIQNAK